MKACLASLKDWGSLALGTDLLAAPFSGINFLSLLVCVSASEIWEFLPLWLPGTGLYIHAYLAIFSIC